MLKVVASVLGIGLIIAGVLGYTSFFAPNGMLLGIFAVDHMHNMVHIISGIIALVSAINEKYARLYLQIFGVIYGLVAALGFTMTGNVLMMHMNMADNFLHLAIALVALYFGFAMRRGTAGGE